MKIFKIYFHHGPDLDDFIRRKKAEGWVFADIAFVLLTGEHKHREGETLFDDCIMLDQRTWQLALVEMEHKTLRQPTVGGSFCW